MTTLYVSTDRPVDPLTIAVAREVHSLARDLKLPHFLAGAMARDILLTNVHGISTGRATRDVDFGVALAGWDQFDRLKRQLLATGRFSESNNVAHRVYYRTLDSASGYPVDIIPFGGVESPPLSIAWPPEKNVIMNVIGYAEAMETIISVEIEPGFPVPIASLPGLALLKLFAWRDRHNETSKDAHDLVVLCRNYHAAGNQDRLYGEEIALLKAVEYNLDSASPRLLGKDVRHIAEAGTLKQAEALLTDQTLRDRLVTHMAAQLKTVEDNVGAADLLLEQFAAGVRDKV